jgi:hypothetical protein
MEEKWITVLQSCLPQTMQVAVLVNCNGLLALGQSEHGLGSLAGLQPVDVSVALGLQSDPGDVMLLGHGMNHRTDNYLHQIAFYGNFGDMLLNGGVGHAGFQQGHFLATAMEGDTGGGQLGNDIATMLANVKLHNCNLL